MTRLIQGNHAAALGALAAGCRFFAGYPITPSSEVAEIMARELPKLGGRFIQMEDEISSMAAVIGASVGGLKAMTATSGPGFSLMQENLGYAVTTEIPCVVMNVMRTGPSTGLPTSPSQGDVMQARWGTHGDHPIIAVTPSSVREAFDLTVKSFNFAERFRSPVILLLDEVVGHMRESAILPDPESVEAENRELPQVPPEWYEPFGEAPNDVPPLAPFGEGYRFHVTGLLHDRRGFPTDRVDEIQAWVDRLFRKIDNHMAELALYDTDGPRDAGTLVVSYGATARSARHAAVMARAMHGRKVRLLRLVTLWPFLEEVVLEEAENARRIVVAEMNRGQIAAEIERLVGRQKVVRVGRSDGRLVTPGEILDAIRAPLGKRRPQRSTDGDQ